jgi:hypothetical protein
VLAAGGRRVGKLEAEISWRGERKYQRNQSNAEKVRTNVFVNAPFVVVVSKKLATKSSRLATRVVSCDG